MVDSNKINNFGYFWLAGVDEYFFLNLFYNTKWTTIEWKQDDCIFDYIL